ncbi:PH domain-containing protein [Sphingobacterium sp. Mn56C]|uniref:PH domain-containing protein n=1 Tax=Sphingobacterium sp. Mn56C TaxID=3395261 RepID=UPI003BD5D0A2
MSLDRYIQDGQDPKIVEKLYTKIVDMLTHGEAISYIALQKKPAVTLLPDSITISNKRIFLCEFTKLGLATNFEIFSWKDIKDIAFKEEIFGSKVTVIPFTAENLSIDYIPKIQARKLYQLIKEALEDSKNEGLLATAAPVKETPKPVVAPREVYTPSAAVEKPVISAPEPQAPTAETVKDEPKVNPVPTTATTTTPVSIPAPAHEMEDEDELTLKLKKLKSLYDKQLITQAEYETKKAEILSEL